MGESEERILRWLLIGAFIVCVVGLIVVLISTVAPWAGFAAGAGLLVIPAVIMIRRAYDSRSDDFSREVTRRLNERKEFGIDELSGGK